MTCRPRRWPYKIKFVTSNNLPLSLVIFMVIGFITPGIATPTESAACGVRGVEIQARPLRPHLSAGPCFCQRDNFRRAHVVYVAPLLRLADDPASQ